MNGVSLQCSELLFRDGLTDNETAKVIVLHLVATGGSGGAGLGEVSLGMLEPLRSGQFEELVYD
jgi:hypothetical protein